MKKAQECSHPNCKLLAECKHPKHVNEGLCLFHYKEINSYYSEKYLPQPILITTESYQECYVE